MIPIVTWFFLVTPFLYSDDTLRDHEAQPLVETQKNTETLKQSPDTLQRADLVIFVSSLNFLSNAELASVFPTDCEKCTKIN